LEGAEARFGLSDQLANHLIRLPVAIGAQEEAIAMEVAAEFLDFTVHAPAWNEIAGNIALI
jgi:hypothetical protein